MKFNIKLNGNKENVFGHLQIVYFTKTDTIEIGFSRSLSSNENFELCDIKRENIFWYESYGELKYNLSIFMDHYPGKDEIDENFKKLIIDELYKKIKKDISNLKSEQLLREKLLTNFNIYNREDKLERLLK